MNIGIGIRIGGQARVAPNLVVNGDFNVDVSSWTAGGGASIARSTAIFTDGGMLVTANGGNNSFATQTVSGLTVGREYTVSCRAYTPSSNSAANNRATIGIEPFGFTLAGTDAQPDRDQIQTISITFTATGATQDIYCSVVASDFSAWGTAGNVAHFDNVSLR